MMAVSSRMVWMARSLLLLSTLVLAGAARAEPPGTAVGMVADVRGEVTATGRDGATRVLATGAPLYNGDRIRTGKGAALRFVMTDRSMYSLAENTEMAIKDFRYQESAPEQDSSVFGLVQGGFRFLSGAIGERNPKKVAYQTAVATIGIRGTEGEVTYDDSDQAAPAGGRAREAE